MTASPVPAAEEKPTETPSAAEPTTTEEKTTVEAEKAAEKPPVFGSGSLNMSGNVFSMFGGGSKPKREEKEDEDGESKKTKEGGEVCTLSFGPGVVLLMSDTSYRTRRLNLLMSTLSH